MPAAGLEPARCRHQWILSPPRLPFRQAGLLNNKCYSIIDSGIWQVIFYNSFQKFFIIPFKNQSVCIIASFSGFGTAFHKIVMISSTRTALSML